jgi:6-phosphogluconolactonase/glucosamine-6-phosphate isomerase/deaminase
MTSQADGAVAIPDVRVCADIDDLSRRAAEAVGDRLNDAVRTRGTCSIVLSGGNTPRSLYRLMWPVRRRMSTGYRRGANKALPLRQVLEGVGDWIRYPAAGIRQGAGTII